MSEADAPTGRELGALPRDSGLPPADEAVFRRARGRIARHHGAWRNSLPGLDALFDDDAHRAHALAGNLATEFADVLAAWRRAAGGDPPAGLVAVFAREWRAASLACLRRQGWDPGAEAAFLQVLEELMARARAADDGRAGRLVGGRRRRLLPARWRARAWRLTRPIRRFFRPSG